MQCNINSKTNTDSFASYLSLNTAEFFIFHGFSYQCTAQCLADLYMLPQTITSVCGCTASDQYRQPTADVS